MKITTVKIWLQPLQWWAASAPSGGNMVKVSQNLGATSVAPVAPVDTSLRINCSSGLIFLKFSVIKRFFRSLVQLFLTVKLFGKQNPIFKK